MKISRKVKHIQVNETTTSLNDREINFVYQPDKRKTSMMHLRWACKKSLQARFLKDEAKAKAHFPPEGPTWILK